MLRLTNSQGPFTFTVVTALIITMYMILRPTQWLKEFMELSRIEWDFKLFLLALGIIYFVFAWVLEKYLARHLSRAIGQLKQSIKGTTKKRKQYKVIQEEMWLM